MDFYRSQDNYILRKGEHSLWCNRVNGNLKIRAGKQPWCLQFDSLFQKICIVLSLMGPFLQLLQSKTYQLNLNVLAEYMVLSGKFNFYQVGTMYNINPMFNCWNSQTICRHNILKVIYVQHYVIFRQILHNQSLSLARYSRESWRGDPDPISPALFR